MARSRLPAGVAGSHEAITRSTAVTIRIYSGPCHAKSRVCASCRSTSSVSRQDVPRRRMGRRPPNCSPPGPSGCDPRRLLSSPTPSARLSGTEAAACSEREIHSEAGKSAICVLDLEISANDYWRQQTPSSLASDRSRLIGKNTKVSIKATKGAGHRRQLRHRPALADRCPRVVATDFKPPHETTKRIGPAAMAFQLDVTQEENWHSAFVKSREVAKSISS